MTDSNATRMQNERLLSAIKYKNINRIETLLNEGCLPNNNAVDYPHPLDLAIRIENPQIVSLLIDRGAHTDLPIQPSKKHIALHRAVMRGNVDVVIKVLQHTTLWDATDIDGASMLHLANEAENEDNVIEIMKIFLDRGMDVDLKTNKGETPLFIAGKYQMKKVIEFLIERGADLNARDCDGNYLIHYVLTEMHTRQADEASFIDWLLSKGVDDNCLNNAGESPLSLACRNKSISVMQLLMKRVDDLHSFRDDQNGMIFHLVIELDEEKSEKPGQIEEMIDFLLNKGHSVDTKNDNGDTVFHSAIKHKKLFAIPKLLEHYTDVNARNNQGKTALHTLIGSCNPSKIGYTDVFEAILSRGADLKIEDNDGLNPMHLAAKTNQIWILRLFKSKGADMKARSANGENLLHLLVSNKQNSSDPEIIEWLIDEGNEINAKTVDGLTPLHVALIAGNSKVVKVLMKHGADVNAEVPYKSVLHLAIEHGCQKDIIKLLLRAGCYCNIVDEYGYPPLHYARKLDTYGEYTGILYLLEAGANLDDIDIVNDMEMISRCVNIRKYLAKCAHADLNIPKVLGSPLEYIRENDGYLGSAFHAKCRSEVEKMKQLQIDEEKSLYDFLRMSLEGKMNSINNCEKLQDIIDFSNLQSNFPLYCEIVLGKYLQAVEKQVMYERVLDLLNQIIGYTLPDVCLRNIFCYLNSRDLWALIGAEKCNMKKRSITFSSHSINKKKRTE